MIYPKGPSNYDHWANSGFLSFFVTKVFLEHSCSGGKKKKKIFPSVVEKIFFPPIKVPLSGLSIKLIWDRLRGDKKTEA